MIRPRNCLVVVGIAVSVFVPGCSCGDSRTGVAPDAGADAMAPDAAITWKDCTGGDEGFVRNAYLAALGQRPRSQAEVDVYTDLMTQVRALAETEPDTPDPREVVVLALADQAGYVDHWAGQLMDALKVTRIEGQSQDSCYGKNLREPDSGQLAAYVRDNPATNGGDGGGSFTMLDLLQSAIRLDDVSPVYRAHMFALISRPIPAANVPRVEAELARREDFGLVFDAAYLNRDIVCLGCHNSEGSTTENPDPELNRHFPLPGLFEKSLFRDSTGLEVARAHAPFRYDGFVADLGDDGQANPWSWSKNCGSFFPGSLAADPAGVDGLFGNLTGDRLTVYELSAALDSGFDSIAASGLQIDDANEIADPNAAFAYLVSASIVEQVWREVIGTPLTIANYFPRNAASRDVLLELTESFVKNRFSVRQLLVDIMMTPYFNRDAPENGCADGAGPYNMPPVYDPWVKSEVDVERQNNGSGDAVSALSGRTLVRAAQRALDWPDNRFAMFPELPSEVDLCDQFFSSCAQMGQYCTQQGGCCFAHDYLCVNPPGPDEPTSRDERTFQRGVGVFLKNGERGFRGLDFQARLVFENRYGACQKPTADADFIDEVLGLAASNAATVGDVVAAVKDRLVGVAAVSAEPGTNGVSERQALEAIFGVGLDSPAAAVTDLDGKTRAFCGVLLSSPQFLLSGIAVPNGASVPVLTPPAVGYDSICGDVAGLGLAGGLTVTCGIDSLTVAPAGL